MVAGRILSFEELGRLWGLAKADVLAFDTIATEEHVLIGVRGRAPISVAKLEEGAVWKHEKLKPKNVNAIDVKYPRFPGAGRRVGGVPLVHPAGEDRDHQADPALRARR